MFHWYSAERRPSRGYQAKKKRGGGNVAGERRRARLLQWEVYSLGTVAVYSFHRVKNFSTLSSCTWNSLLLFIHQCGISLTWVEMLDMPSITRRCLEKNCICMNVQEIKRGWDKLLLAPKRHCYSGKWSVKRDKSSVQQNNKTAAICWEAVATTRPNIWLSVGRHEAAQESATYVNRTSETIHITEGTLRVAVKKRGKERAEKPTSSMYYPTDMRAFAPVSSLFTLMNAITRDDASEQTFVSISTGRQGFPVARRASHGPQAWHHSCDTLPSSGWTHACNIHKQAGVRMQVETAANTWVYV